MHYRRWQRHGDPLYIVHPARVQRRLEDKFWSKVRKSDGCWEWTANKLPAGYGQFRTGKHDPMGTRNWLAHRLAYTLEVGEIPEGLEINHLCNNPSCVRPDHLEVVTHAQNLHYSDSVQFKRNAAKTHCKHGHEFTEANTIRRTDRPSYRGCRQCGRNATKRYLTRKRHGTL